MATDADPVLPLGLPGSWVVLAGTGRHIPGSALPDVPAVAGTVRDLGRVLVERCGVAPDRLVTLVDPTPAELHGGLVDAAERATDVLLFYYVGHGLVSSGGELHLATADTDHVAKALATKALPYSAVRDAVTECSAPSIVVVLDCCFAGRARGSFGTPVADAMELASLGGTYLLASAAREEQALAPEGAEHTAFSGELIRFVREGDPTASALFTIEDAYRHLSRVLPRRGAPAPHRQLSGRTGELFLASNPAAPPLVVRRTQASDEDGQPERPSPYRGLAAFSVEDARYFFGRDELTGELVRRLAARSREVGLFAVVGPSGAGKSSLLHAGLLPAVAQGRLPIPGSRTWPRVALTPGEHPMETLASRLAGPADTSREALVAEPATFAGVVRRMLLRRAGDSATTPDGRLLLVVDQFEEVFTACRDDDERTAFITAISAASTPRADGGPAPALVVLGMRADFYGRCLAYPRLLPALEEGQVLVTPMSATQLRAVIEKPAEVAGLHLEDGLTDLLLHDLGAGASQGDALPLLSYTLLSTWQRREGQTLTLAGYRATGGIWDAVTQQADRAYEALDPAGQRAARTMLLRMVRIGDDTEEPRRVDLADLLAHGPAGEAALTAFADARLVTTDQDTARITHDALLRTWPRLRRWIAEDRARMLVHQQLTEAAETWRRDDRDRGGLYRGTRLAAARQWLTEDNRADLSELEHEFLRASTHAARRRRLLAVAAVVVLLLTTAAGMFAVQQYRIAADRDAVLASQEIAARAEAIRGGDPAAALQLSLAAYRLSRTPETRAALYTSDTTPYPVALRGHIGKVRHVVFSADGRTLASSDDRGTVRLWDVSTPHRPAAKAVLTVRGATVVALSPTANVLAVHAPRSLQLWDVTDADSPHRTASIRTDTNAARAMTFSADGSTLAVGGDHGVWLWHITGARPTAGTTVSADARQVTAVALHPNGQTLATVSDGGAVRLWNLTTPTPTIDTMLQILSARGVVFSPDGNTLVVGGADGKLHVWDVTNPRAPGPLESALSTTRSYEQLPDEGNIFGAAFSPDGRTVAAAGETGVLSRAVISGQVGTFDFSWRELPTMGVPNLGAAVNTIAFSQDNHSLATGGDDRTVRIWTTPGPSLIQDYMINPRRVGTSFGAGGRTMVTGEWAGTDKTRGARLWDLTDPRRPRLAATLPAPWGHAGFLTDGRTLLAEDNNTFAAALWNAGTPQRPRLQAVIPTGSDPEARLDNHIVMTNSVQEGTVELWDVTDPANPVRAGSVTSTGDPPLAGAGMLVIFGLLDNGRLVGSFDTDYVPLIWDITDPHHPGAPVRLAEDDERSAPPRTQGGPLGDFGPGLLMEVIKERHITIWDVADPRHPTVKTRIPIPANDAKVIHDGQVLVTWREATRTVGFWNISDPRHPTALTRYVADTTSVELYTSPDSRTVAAVLGSRIGDTSSSDDRVRFWDTSSPDTVLERTGLPSTANRLAFSPDNHTVATEIYNPDYGYVVQLWELDPDRLYRQICATTGNTITPEQWARHLPNRPYQQPCET